MHKKSLRYRDAGVDIDAGNVLVENIKTLADSTHRPEILSGLGGFGGLFKFASENYQQPILVAATDGVGTKLKLAIELKQHQTIGIDLVAMCVNDLIVQGATPLFFLDYYATSKLDISIATEVIKGISNGCRQAGCALLGGETAEMPGLYQPHDYDLAGFSVGVVEQEKLLDGRQVKIGDAAIALASSGIHANGYSLVRKIIADTNLSLDETLTNNTWGESLLTPTKIYVKSILTLLAHEPVHAVTHITGGGLLENIPRVLPNDCCAMLDTDSWQWPSIFQQLQQRGNIVSKEMLRTFNCGVGMVVITPQDRVSACIDNLNRSGETAWQIGEIIHRKTSEAGILLSGM